MKNIFILLIAFMLASCGTLHKTVHKAKADTSSVTSTHDKSVTIIREKIDTSVKIKGDTAKASAPLESITHGDTLKAQSDGTSVEVYYEASTGRIHAKAITKPKEVPIQIERTTEVHADVRQVQENRSHKETLDKQVDHKETNLLNPWLWLVWLILLLALLYLLWRFVPKFI